MKKSILLSMVASSLLIADDYLPLSKIGEDKKLEYNFKTIDNTLIKAENIKTESTVENKEIVEEVQTEIQTVEEKPQINKPIIVEKEVLKKEDLILRDEVKIEPAKQKNVVKEDSIEKTKLELKKDIFFTAAITYSPITAELSSGGTKYSNDSNVFIPEAQLEVNQHKFAAEYFKSENDFASQTIDTTWYKGGYRYSYLNANIGLDLNYIEMKSSSETNEELFPSFEIDFNHNIDNIQFSYGAGYGKNNSIDYAYDYFLNVGIKPYALSEASLVAGYKNRTIEQDEEKIEFQGPYIGVKSRF